MIAVNCNHLEQMHCCYLILMTPKYAREDGPIASEMDPAPTGRYRSQMDIHSVYTCMGISIVYILLEDHSM